MKKENFWILRNQDTKYYHNEPVKDLDTRVNNIQYQSK